MANEVISNPIPVDMADPRITVVDGDRSTARAIEAAGEFTGDAIRGYQVGKAKDALSDVTETFSVVGEMRDRGVTYNPVTGGLEGEQVDAALAEQVNRVRSKSEQAFKSIALASEQGMYGASRQATLEIEKRIRQLSAQTPGFEDEIRRTAASVLGYDPTGFAIREILDQEKPDDRPEKLDPYTQAYKDAKDWLTNRSLLGGTSLSPQQIEAQARDIADRKFQNDTLKDAQTSGSLNADQAATEYMKLEHPVLSKLWAKHRDLSATGQGLDFSSVQSLTQELNRMADQEVANLVDKATQGGSGIMSIEARSNLEKSVRDKYNRVIESLPSMVENNFMEKNLEKMAFLAEYKMWDRAEDIMILKNGAGEAIASTFIEVMANAVDDGHNSLLIQRYPWLREFVMDKSGKESFFKDASKRALELFQGSTVTPSGESTSTGNPERDTQIDQFVIEQTMNAAKKTGDKQLYQEQLEALYTNKPDAALSLVANDPDSFSFLNDEQRVRVGEQITTLGFELSQQLAADKILIKWAPREFVIDTVVGDFGGPGYQARKRRRAEQEYQTGRFVAVETDGTPVTAYIFGLQEELDRLNNEAVKIMSDPRWVRRVTGRDGGSIDTWAKQFERASEVFVITSEMEDIDQRLEEYSEKLPSLRAAQSLTVSPEKREELRQAEIKRLNNQRVKLEDRLSTLVTANRESTR